MTHSQSKTRSGSVRARTMDQEFEEECSICESDTKLLQCDRCDKWKCSKCIKITEAEYKVMCMKKNISYYCDNCQVAAKEAVRTENIIEIKCKEFMDTMASFIAEVKMDMELKLQSKADKRDLEDLCKKVSENKIDIEKMKTATEAKAEGTVIDDLKEQFRELEDRERRRLNVFVYNAEESNNENPAMRKTHDERLIKDIVKEELDMDITIINSGRIGRKKENPSNTPRPLRITVADVGQKTKMLQLAPKLRNSRNDVAKNLFLKNDMTVKERDTHKRLREELKARKEESERAGDNLAQWRIQRGRVTNIGRYPVNE